MKDIINKYKINTNFNIMKPSDVSNTLLSYNFGIDKHAI